MDSCADSPDYSWYFILRTFMGIAHPEYEGTERPILAGYCRKCMVCLSYSRSRYVALAGSVQSLIEAGTLSGRDFSYKR